MTLNSVCFLRYPWSKLQGDIAIDDVEFIDCALPPVKRSCPEFTCTRKSCVKRDYKCDYNDDCGDNSDESLSLCGKT